MLLTEGELSQLKTDVVKIRERAYCPYSNFRVGCTIITSDGTFISAANVENASYGAAICAERSAITKAVLEGHTSFKLVAISGNTPNPISPCGICRQVIREFGKETPVYMYNKDASECTKSSIDKLLPLSFGPEDLQ